MSRITGALRRLFEVALAASLAGAGLSAAGQEANQTSAGIKQSLDPAWVGAFQWRSIGPATMGGRCVAIAVYEKDPCIYWVATASGGLLKTTNNGVTYEHQFDHENTVSIGHVAVCQGNPDIVWVGTGEANPRNSVSYGDGVYKSTDGGKTWTHMGLKESFQIGRIAIHPENPDIVYVGALGRLWGPNEERGLYKTSDGGKSWEKILYIDEATGVIDVDMHPTAPDTLYVATYERLRDGTDSNDPVKKYGPGSGIHKTTDGGKTWTKLTEGLPTVNLGRVGIDIYRANPEVVFAIIESERIQKLAPDVGEMGVEYEDADVGARLTRIEEGGPAESAELKAGDIIVGMNTQFVASADDLTGFIHNQKAGDTATVEFVRDKQLMKAEVTFIEREDPDAPIFPGVLGGQRENIQELQGRDAFQTGGVYRSENGGQTWTRINSLNPRPMYYSQIRVDPSDEKYLYVCGTSLHRSDDGGKTFRGDGGRGGVHVDHHALWIDPADGRHMILGNDGGIYVTWDRMETWEHHNKNAMGQYYHCSVDHTPFYNVYGGLQDNGSWGGPNRTRTFRGPVNSDWFRVGGGDGFVTIADPEDPHRVYFESQNGGIGRIHLSDGDRGFMRPPRERGVRYRFNWKTPYILSSHNTRIYYVAGNYVLRSFDRGNDLKKISPEISRVEDDLASAIGESHFDSDLLYVGTTHGGFWVTTNGGYEWTNIGFPVEERTEEAEAEEADEAAPSAPLRRAATIRQMIRRLDSDGDGKLQRSEVPDRMHEFFDRSDLTKDGVIDEADIALIEAAEPAPAEAARDPITGTWKARLIGEAIPEEARSFTLTLKLEEDGRVNGTLQSPTMAGVDNEGTFNPETGELNMRFRDESGAVSLTAVVRDDAMTGEIAVAAGLLQIRFEAEREPVEEVVEETIREATVQPEGEQVSPPVMEEPEEAPAEHPLAGEWDATLLSEEMPPEMSKFSMVLKVDAAGKISGDVHSQMGDAVVANASFTAATGAVRFQIRAEGFVATLEGKVEGDRMTGTITADQGGMVMVIDFEAKKVKLPGRHEGTETGRQESESRRDEETKRRSEKPDRQMTKSPNGQTAGLAGQSESRSEGVQNGLDGGSLRDFVSPTLRLFLPSPDPVSGEWQGQLTSDEIPPDQAKFTLKLTLNADGTIIGTFTSPEGDFDITSGDFNADTGAVTLTVTLDEGALNLSGTVKDGSMTGEIVIGEGNLTAPFKATRTAPAQQEREAEAQAEQARGERPSRPPAGQTPAPPVPVQPADPVTGEWTGTLSRAEFSSEFEMTLKLEAENRVTGVFSSRFIEADIEDGSFNPQSRELKFSVEGEMGTSQITATVEENKMTGRLSSRGGEFTIDLQATRQVAEAEEEAPRGPKLTEILPVPMYASSIETSRHAEGRVYVTFDGHRSDNDDPWVLVSEDRGESWRSLRANLPRGSTHCVREDLENPDVLYLGTEFGLYVSVDRGESWTRFHNNFPTVAVHEVAQHPTMGEIVAGTHGRSLWVVDVTPLRQMTAEARQAKAHLYKPQTVVRWRFEPSRGETGLQEFVGGNPTDGAIIYYSLKEEPESMSLSIQTLDGETVRELEGATEPGLHRVVWDLRRAAEEGRRRRRGQPVEPGVYRVVLVVNGQRMTQDFSIVPDPDFPDSPFEIADEELLDEEWREDEIEDRHLREQPIGGPIRD